MLNPSLTWISNVRSPFDFRHPPHVNTLTPTHSVGTNRTDSHSQTHRQHLASCLFQRPFDDHQIHHHVTPSKDQHSIIPLGDLKFPA